MNNNNNTSIPREIYEGFQRDELDRWDKLIAPDVVLFSPGAQGLKGIEPLKNWAHEFVKAFQPRIDLLDEFDGIKNGEGRAFIVVNLNWKHTQPFFTIPPTGREGTEIETFSFRVQKGKVIRFDVADNTLDLAIYLWERGWPQIHNAFYEPFVQGITRR